MEMPHLSKKVTADDCGGFTFRFILVIDISSVLTGKDFLLKRSNAYSSDITS